MPIVCALSVAANEDKYAMTVAIARKITDHGYVTTLVPYADKTDDTKMYIVVDGALTCAELSASTSLPITNMQHITDVEQFLSAHPELVAVHDADASAPTATFILGR